MQDFRDTKNTRNILLARLMVHPAQYLISKSSKRRCPEERTHLQAFYSSFPDIPPISTVVGLTIPVSYHDKFV